MSAGWTAFYELHWHVARAALWLLGGCEVRGTGKVPLEGPLIIASNHASYMDPPAIGCCIPRPVGYMARETLFDNPLFGAWIRSLNAFPVDRDGDSRQAIRQACERLAEGWALLVFPEGTRTVTGHLQEVRGGAGMLAARSGAPVLPVYLWGSYQSWPRGRSFPSRHRFKFLVGDVISVSKGLKGAERKKEQVRIQSAVDEALHGLEHEAWKGEEPPVPLSLPVPADAPEDASDSTP